MPKLLIPLDGSEPAEAILPYVASLIRDASDSVHLLSVLTQPYFVYAAENLAMMTELRECDANSAREYLKRIEQRLKAQGIGSVVIAVEYGAAATKICDYSQRAGCDMIALTSHGRSGISQWLIGSTADRVLRHATMPVFIVRGAAPDAAEPRSITQRHSSALS